MAALHAIVAEAQRRADEVESGMCVKTGEVFPTDVAPVLVAPASSSDTSIASAASLRAKPMVWGYPGFDARRHSIFNTRIEQAAQRPMWRDSFALRRCVVPASGFYEWQRGGSRTAPKQKLLFTVQDEPMLYLAGIYRSFGAPAETDSLSVIRAVSTLHKRFSIMTTAANASVSDVHDRMPVVLRPDELEEWLFGEPRAFSSRASIPLERQKA
jgi:putative SOS response-associated peptidase YedK